MRIFLNRHLIPVPGFKSYQAVTYLLGLVLLPALLSAELRLPGIFGAGMVLQRDAEIQVWGWSDPGSQVTVSLEDHKIVTHSDAAGNWSLSLPPLPAGGPYDLKVMAKDTLVLGNVLIGEVWICSGQSNMGMTVGGSSRVLNYKQEIARANFPRIRLLTVDHAMAATPRNDLKTSGWAPCSPESAENFSATAYFFGRQLHQDLDGIPIGLIHTSWGGTKLEAWTSAEALEVLGPFEAELAAVDGSTDAQDAAILGDYKAADMAWRNRVDSLAGDLRPDQIQRFLTEHQDWQVMQIPDYWENTPTYKKFDGIMWFQRSVEIPAGWEGQELCLSLGTIDDYDRSYFNGVAVGSNNSRARPSEYSIAADLVREGKNLIAVRVVDVNRRGGIWGRPRDLYLTPLNGGDTLWLEGSWSFTPVMEWENQDLLPPENPYLHNRPSVLYNAMLAPLMPLAIRGVIWYQGEANASRAHLYRRTFPAMIQDWRRHWEQGDFPFLYVQLANFGPRQVQPAEHNWAELRDAQLQTLSVPNTAMAVIIDIGDERDIHPKNKQEVGRRLALLALDDVYQQPGIISRGPSLAGYRTRWRCLVISFDDVAGGLSTSDGRDPRGFSLAGEDGKFHWAEARIKGARIILTSDGVRRPVAARYGWAGNPDCNLINSAGLPASPFKTDDWPDTTQ